MAAMTATTPEERRRCGRELGGDRPEVDSKPLDGVGLGADTGVDAFGWVRKK